mgnify:CR=1 FL=1
MSISIIIPARFGSTRLPGKPLIKLGNRTLIQHVYQNCSDSGAKNVVVATDDLKIRDEVESFGGEVCLTESSLASGSDRVASAVENLGFAAEDIIVNVQGDEPFVDGESLKNLIEVFKNDHDHEIALASLMTRLNGKEEIQNPSNVKVIVDLNNFALYFSRAAIPHDRDGDLPTNYHKHIGVYAFRKNALLEFSQQEITPLEAAEKIECIRYLEHGKKLKMVYTDRINFGIDTPEDLQRAKAHLKKINSK